MLKKAKRAPDLGELRQRAEAQMKEQRPEHQRGPGGRRRAGKRGARMGTGRGSTPANSDAPRMVHELQVHQIELQMQNAELRRTRHDVEAALEKYTDLYEFAPVGFFSIDEQGVILDVNLTGAGLLGIERSRITNRRMHTFVAPDSRPAWVAFAKRVFGGTAKQSCEVSLLNQRGVPFWAALQATSAEANESGVRWCRLALEDISARKHAEEAQLRVEGLSITNQELMREIVRRVAVESTLKESERHQAELLEQSRHLQEQLRGLSRQVLNAQEEERKRISRELHDEIAQTLTAILVHLMILKPQATANPKGLATKDPKRTIARIERLVRKSVKIVQRFARSLRPTMLDDLGLTPALQSLIKDFARRTKLTIELIPSSGLEQLDGTQRTALYRVVQSALTNVAQHAQARRVTVRISRVGTIVSAEIQDDGKSFNVQDALSARRYARLGLIGMRERVEMLGGVFSVESAPGHGTTIRARVPLRRGGGTGHRSRLG